MKIVRRINNKLKGAYGETKYLAKKIVISINKKAHKKIKKDQSIPKRSRSLIDTIVHEEIHSIHPRMHEKTVRKLAPRRVSKMSQKTKNKYYNKYK